MDVAELRAFLAVAEKGGFRAAAQTLFTSQPSVSRSIARLESELGVPLFERDRSGTTLTAHGQALRNGVPGILSAVDRVRAETIGQQTTTLRLGAASTAAATFLAPFLSTWIPRHPELRIVMLHDGAIALRTRLENDECDAAIIAAPIPRSLLHHHLGTVHLVAAIPPSHRLAETEDPLAVSELHREQILVNGATFLTTQLLTAACQLAGAEPEIVYQCDVAQTLAALAEAGLGIAIMGDNELRGPQLVRRLLHSGDGSVLSFDLHVAWRRDAQLAPGALRFLADLGASPRAPATTRD